MGRDITIDEIVVGDEADAWRAAGFTVDDDGVCAIGRVRVRLVGRDQGKRILRWSLRNAPEGDIDGLPTSTSDAAAPEHVEHANGSQLIDHVVLITPDTDRTVAAFARLGLEPRRTRPTDTYGMPMLQTFFRAGEVILELIGPEEPTGDDPAGFFGLAHTVADIDATRRLLGDDVGEVKEAVQPGRRIATLRHRNVGMSVATAFMSPEPG